MGYIILSFICLVLGYIIGSVLAWEDQEKGEKPMLVSCEKYECMNNEDGECTLKAVKLDEDGICNDAWEDDEL